MKVKLYWILLVVAAGAVIVASLFLASPLRNAAVVYEQQFTNDEVVTMVGAYLVDTEYLYETPLPDAFSEVNYLGEGKWSGKYSGLSAYGDTSTIIWDFYEQAKAVQIVLGYDEE